MKLGRLAAAGLVVLLGALPATAQVQESCTFDDATATVTAVMTPGGEPGQRRARRDRDLRHARRRR